MTKYLSVEEVADLIAPDGLDKHMWTWRRMADGRIPGAIRIDRTHMVIPEGKLTAWLESNTVEPAHAANDDAAPPYGVSPRVWRNRRKLD